MAFERVASVDHVTLSCRTHVGLGLIYDIPFAGAIIVQSTHGEQCSTEHAYFHDQCPRSEAGTTFLEPGDDRLV